MQGGKKGLLVNSRDLCTHHYFSALNFVAHNGKSLVEKRLPLGVAACHGIKKPKKNHKKAKSDKKSAAQKEKSSHQ
jgi:hypothetical protein